MNSLSDYITEGLLDNKLLKPLRDFIQRNFKKRVGFKEMITVCIQGDKYEFTATIDTGNGGVVPTLGVDKMTIDGDKVTVTIGDKEYTFDKKGEASPTVGNVVHHRPIIIIDYIKIGGRKLDEPFIAVTDERKKSTRSLINRDTMSKLNLVVDPSKNNLIKEGFRINKDTEIENTSIHCDMYNVHVGDKVLGICSSPKTNTSYKYVKLFVGIIEEINGETIILKSYRTGKVVREIEYTFEDHTHSSPHIQNTFAFYKKNGEWSALMKVDKAIKMIDDYITNKKLFLFSSFRYDTGVKPIADRIIEIKKIKKELEND